MGGYVAAGGLFAILQSAAMGGFGVFILSAVGAGAYATVLAGAIAI